MSCFVYCVYFILLGFFIGVARGRHLELSAVGRLELVALDNFYRPAARGEILDQDQDCIESPQMLGICENYRFRWEEIWRESAGSGRV